jgi:hypothetical protein
MSRIKSITRTVRIDDDVDRLLVEYAEKNGISVNLLIERALKKHTEWQVYAGKFGFLDTPLSLYSRIMGLLSLEQAKELGLWVGRNFAKDFILFWFKKIDFGSAIKGLELLGSSYARFFEFIYENEGLVHTIILKHDRGINSSILWDQVVRYVFAELIKMRVETEVTSDQLVARIHSTKFVTGNE